MRKRRFPIEQVVAALRQAEMGMAVGDLIHELGICEQTLYRLKNIYGGPHWDQARALKHLQDENARLKKRAAELSLDKAIWQDVASRERGGLR